MKVLVFGNSGSGKSTYARALATLLPVHVADTRRIHCVWPERDPGARFEVLVVSADGHRTLNTQRIDD